VEQLRHGVGRSTDPDLALEHRPGVLAAAASVTLSSAFVAFGFMYFRFPGRNLLFGLVLGTIMLPGVVTLVPTFLI
jgi:ABC-type glycerol-3-phosphate transport system permease component